MPATTYRPFLVCRSCLPLDNGYYEATNYSKRVSCGCVDGIPELSQNPTKRKTKRKAAHCKTKNAELNLLMKLILDLKISSDFQ